MRFEAARQHASRSGISDITMTLVRRVLVLLLLFIVPCVANAVNSRTICGQTVTDSSYTGTFPYWMDGTAVLYGPSPVGSPIFLGQLTPSESSTNSILTRSGAYGSSSSSTSIFNSSGTWGSASSSVSVCNLFATSGPQIFWGVTPVGYLTSSLYASGAVDPVTLVAALLRQAYLLSLIAPASVPGAPTMGSAVAGNGSATVSFTAPSDTGGATITGYTVTASPGGLTATGSGSPITVSGLTNGTAYTFTVKATNSVGAGVASAASNSVTPVNATTPVNSTTPANAARPMVSAGTEYSFALQSDGSVLAWGKNDSGQLGNGQGAYSVSPIKVTGIGPLAAMAAGVGFSLALDRSGGIWAWGLNASGELADGTMQSRYVPRRITGVNGTPTAVAAGNSHALALNDAGQVWVWGSLLGTSDRVNLAPQVMAGLSAIKAIEAGQFHALALDRDGQVWAWGKNDAGQIGDGTTTSRTVPVHIAALPQITSISAGTYHNLALDTSGRVWAWGNNVYGTIGNGGLSPRQVTTPVALTGLPRIAWVYAGSVTSVAIEPNGGVWMWGTQAYGVNTLGAVRYVAELSALGMIEIRSGWYHLLGRDGAGRVWGWGRNERGYIGNGDTAYQTTAVQVSGLSNAVSLSAQLHSLALTADGSLWAWGESGNGELGDGTPAISNLPVSTAGLASIRSIAAGGFHILASSSDGRVWGWGRNDNYQLGDQTTVPRSTPATIVGISNVVSVAAGTSHSLALDQSGQVWSWGLIDSGQLGRTGNRGLPGLVSGLPRIKAIAAGATHSLAVGTDGSVWAWGSNASGQLGDGTQTNRSAPVRVTNLSNVVSAEGGSAFSIALDASGVVWAWGSNAFGQLGDGTAVDRIAPVRVAGPVSAIEIAAGGGHSAAVTTDGRLWTWGTNRDGQLGLPITQSGSANAVVLTDLQDIIGVSAGWNHTVALRADGTVWSAGRNFSGALGDGTLAQRDSLTLVLNASGDGALDLNPSVANTVPASKRPPLLARTSRVGDLSSLSLTANVKPSLIGASGFASSQGFAAAGCSPCEVFVAALLGDSSVYLADERGNWSAPSPQQISSGTLSAFLRNAQVSSATALFLNILQNVDLTGLPGAQIIVGYGTNAQEMLSAGRYRSIFSVPTQ
jgi:alpha-tubulin suppressor-like RCC1 family protein